MLFCIELILFSSYSEEMLTFFECNKSNQWCLLTDSAILTWPQAVMLQILKKRLGTCVSNMHSQLMSYLTWLQDRSAWSILVC